MPTLTIHEAVLYGIATGFAFTGGYLFWQSRKTLLTLKPNFRNKEEQQNKVTGNIGNLAARDVVIKKEKSKPCERELLLWSQCKDLQNTVNVLFEQLQYYRKINNNLLRKLEASEKRFQELREQHRRVPVLPIGTWKKEEPV